MTRRKSGGGTGDSPGVERLPAVPERGGGGEVLLYTTEDGRARVECRFAEDSLWMSQALMAELFQTTPQNITLHLKALYREGEIVEPETCKEYLQVRREGGREVRQMDIQNPDPRAPRIKGPNP